MKFDYIGWIQAMSIATMMLCAITFALTPVDDTIESLRLISQLWFVTLMGFMLLIYTEILRIKKKEVKSDGDS